MSNDTKHKLLSVIILTYNDEVQIESTLQSIKNLANEIIIIDSYSTDSTEEICRRYTEKFYKNNFINQGIQFNWALDNVEIAGDWILRLDSDEIVPQALVDEIENILKGHESPHNGYFLNRKMFWMGRFLNYGGLNPHNIARLFRKGFGRYETITEEHLIVNGTVGYLKNWFYEDNRKNTVEYFTRKHLDTAEGEVRELLSMTPQGTDSLSPRLFGKKIERTRYLKLNLYNRSPAFIRALLYFVYRYVLKFGFLDGRPGLIFHTLQAFWYRFYIDSRIYEIKRTEK